jgi:hypothetical protein
MLRTVSGFACLRLLALVVWLTASIHCRLASLPGFAFLNCASSSASVGTCEAPAQDTDCPAGEDDCDSVESGRYRSEEPTSVQPPSHELACGLPVPLGLESIRVRWTKTLTPETSPPPCCWHLVLRASGTPRAPSLPA